MTKGVMEFVDAQVKVEEVRVEGEALQGLIEHFEKKGREMEAEWREARRVAREEREVHRKKTERREGSEGSDEEESPMEELSNA